MRLLIAAILAMVFSTQVEAQAFGVQMGAPVSQYSGVHPDGINNPYFYKISVPEPNGEFDSYSAFATRQTGICKVSGIGRDHKNDDYGTATRSAFEDLQHALTTRYGRSRDYDFLHAGALWNEPREWVWSIYKNERSLTSFWTTESGSMLSGNVQSIMLDTNSVNPVNGAYLTLAYEFSNWPACKAIMDRSNNNGL